MQIDTKPKSSIKNIILDLDHTLVLTSDEKLDSKIVPKEITFIEWDGEEPVTYYLYPRPGCEALLEQLKNFKFGIWSLGQPNYVKVATAAIGVGIGTEAQYQAEFIYNWCNCIRKPGRIVKPIAESPFKMFQNSTVIIEDCANACEEGDMRIIVPKYEEPSETDTCLVELTSYLSLGIFC